MNIYTYYIPVPGKSEADELQLVNLWKQSWRHSGWNPVVLTAADLPSGKEHEKMLRRFRRKPSTMKPGLGYSWFCRWLAVAHQGGGFMCDYDVMNYGFSPRPAGEMTVYSGVVPCLVSGTPDEFMKICRIFAEYRFDWKDRVGWWFDTSDMKILLRRRGLFHETMDCVEHTRPGWEEATAVHYSNFAMKPPGYIPRHEWIPKLRPPCW